MAALTKTDIDRASEWRVNDEPTHLREWGTEITYQLPTSRGERIIGAADGCWLKLVDRTRRVSAHHARLVHATDGWMLQDLHSNNGIRVDGAIRRICVLTPGVEIGIGGIT